MKRLVVAFISGVVFAVGLAISGMTRPEKVIGFLDLAGAWDASLAFVMIGAIGVHFAAQRLVRTRRAPFFDSAFHLPVRTAVDRRLIIGAGIFGVGWGLGGFCPGPGLVAAAAGGTPALLFVAGMTAGVLVEGAFARRASKAPSRVST